MTSHRTSRASAHTTALAAAVLMATVSAAAASQPAPPAIPPLPPVRATTPQAEPHAGRLSAGPEHTALVRATLSALNDANLTGNYSVLRDAAAPSFAERYSVADLAVAFTTLRASPNFATAAHGTPVVTHAMKPSGTTIVLKGHLAARPDKIGFDVQYERIKGRWRLSALAVSLPDRKAANTSTRR